MRTILILMYRFMLLLCNEEAGLWSNHRRLQRDPFTAFSAELNVP
jgi:hypothetical protein